MTVHELSATGYEALMLASELLQRSRRARPTTGVWEAADLQWWWRSPRHSDEIEKLFWIDGDGPVAGVLLTSWTDETWQCDPVVMPDTSHVSRENVWARALERIVLFPQTSFEIPVQDDDPISQGLVESWGFVGGDEDATAWLDLGDQRREVSPPPGFSLVDRTLRPNHPHPMIRRGGQHVGQRLQQCPLYDPELDLAIETADGQIAGYSLYWFDPTTKVGLVEPVRVEDEFQRRGLARTMLTAGIARLFSKGARRVKVSYSSDAAGTLYQGVGFRQESTTTWYRRPAVDSPVP